MGPREPPIKRFCDTGGTFGEPAAMLTDGGRHDVVMDLLTLVPFLAAAVAIAWALVERARRKRAQRRSIELDGRKRSAATRYGQLSDQFAPFMERWPVGEPQSFRFLGDPIEDVQFKGDGVY